MSKIICRYFNKPCLEASCTHWVRLSGADPQTGVQTDEYLCADIAMVKIALEGNKETRQIQAAVNSAAADTSRLNAAIVTPYAVLGPRIASPDPALEDLS